MEREKEKVKVNEETEELKMDGNLACRGYARLNRFNTYRNILD
jgi:hypothetical protein